MLLSTHYRMTRPAACLLAIGALVGGYACGPAVNHQPRRQRRIQTPSNAVSIW